MSQKEQILRYMQQGNTITPLEALRLFGCLRLGARIDELKDENYQIESTMVRLQGGKRVAQYRLVQHQMELPL